MTYILGLGGPSDSLALKLETRKRRWINNVCRAQLSRELMEERIRVSLGAARTARCVSVGSISNCFGMVFASRRTAIVDSIDVEKILKDDEYHALPWDPASWQPGDVVLYRNENGEIVHAGFIYRIEARLDSDEIPVLVQSIWGETGEYIHAIDDVPPLLGRPSEVVAQRYLWDEV